MPRAVQKALQRTPKRAPLPDDGPTPPAARRRAYDDDEDDTAARIEKRAAPARMPYLGAAPRVFSLAEFEALVQRLGPWFETYGAELLAQPSFASGSVIIDYAPLFAGAKHGFRAHMAVEVALQKFLCERLGDSLVLVRYSRHVLDSMDAVDRDRHAFSFTRFS